jgi:hypothetical protein
VENAFLLMSEFKRQNSSIKQPEESLVEHSAEVIAELAEYHNRKGFFGKVFVLHSPSVTDATVW